MKILKDLAVEIPDTNSYHWNFEEFEFDDGNHLAIGYNSLAVQSYDSYRGHDGSRVALFNNWAPCEYAQRNLRGGVDALHQEDKFDYIFTICPFTADWRNKNAGTKRYIYAFYPYSPGIIPERREKNTT